MDTLLAAVEAHGTGAPPAPSPATSSSAAALSGGHGDASVASVARIDGGASQSPSMPRQIEIPSSLGRAPTYMNAVLGERGAALQEATGWTLGTSISREVAGIQEKVLKTKWRVANAATGPIVVGFAARQGTLVYIQYDDTLSTPFSTVKIQTRLPAGRYTYPEPASGQWNTPAGQPRIGTMNHKWMLAANKAMEAWVLMWQTPEALKELLDGKPKTYRVRAIKADRKNGTEYHRSPCLSQLGNTAKRAKGYRRPTAKPKRSRPPDIVDDAIKSHARGTALQQTNLDKHMPGHAARAQKLQAAADSESAMFPCLKLVVGRTVQIHGLTGIGWWPQNNGKIGKVSSYDEHNGRYSVVVAGESLSVRAGNLRVVPPRQDLATPWPSLTDVQKAMTLEIEVDSVYRRLGAEAFIAKAAQK
eukprot:COSAG01_NODE_7982_length_2965_cov_4.504536_1_plen_417_part_00